MRPWNSVTERVSLVAVIDRFAGGLEHYDPSFARTLAAALHAHRARISLPPVEEMGLRDVVITFRMDGQMQLVVTGNLSDGPGEVTLRFHEADFPEVEVCLLVEPRAEPYLFATLDHGWRGRSGRNLETGEVVEIRSLTTVGAEISWHVRGRAGSERLALQDLELVEV